MLIARWDLYCSLLTIAACASSPSAPSGTGSTRIQPLLAGSPRANAQITPWQVERYPKQPAPYAYMDWRQRAIDFDNYVFSGTNNPFTLRWDDTHYNMPTQTFAMISYIGDTRTLVNGEQEALAGFQAVLSGALVGIDKTQFPFGDGHAIDYVSRLQTFYHKTATRRSLYNKPQPDAVKSGHFTSWWYDHASLPMVYALATKYPNITLDAKRAGSRRSATRSGFRWIWARASASAGSSCVGRAPTRAPTRFRPRPTARPGRRSSARPRATAAWTTSPSLPEPHATCAPT